MATGLDLAPLGVAAVHRLTDRDTRRSSIVDYPERLLRGESGRSRRREVTIFCPYILRRLAAEIVASKLAYEILAEFGVAANVFRKL